MFSFENEQFQSIFDDLQTPRCRNKNWLREKLQWFFECVEQLSVDEVIFVLSLRCCDASFRTLALRTLRQYVRVREEFMEMMGELGKKEVERRNKRKRL